MPAQPFSVHVDPDDLARADLTAAVDVPPATGRTDTRPGRAARHGAGDDRQAARERSGRARSGRAAAAGTGRSYAFRRS
ncbi:hypothetical protein [Pseudosporangium ferrugineum]|uniref:Uncharacterized protein n=1 Tax=Pseudosporangium ferrugineum TaxID=439699 RepID=A0A2T0SJU9_9ACTN|nr:hypothetical protein [Pseudosporangium ferrugineum]PRY33684.1 hypothetical protein CLV70_101847 [Pseudosporangium ferrugineum]